MYPFPEIKVIGPDRFCPDCGRQLLFMDHEEGTFTVADNSYAYISDTISYEDMSDIPSEIEAVPEVYCLRRRCRFKRWRRREKIEQPEFNDDVLLTALRRTRWAAYILAAAGFTLAFIQLLELLFSGN